MKIIIKFAVLKNLNFLKNKCCINKRNILIELLTGINEA